MLVLKLSDIQILYNIQTREKGKLKKYNYEQIVDSGLLRITLSNLVCKGHTLF